MPLEAGLVLGVLAEGLGVDVKDFCRRRRGSYLRAVAARYLMRYAGQTQREVAEELKAGSGSAISKQISMHKEAMEDAVLVRKLLKIDRRLSEAKRERTENNGNS